MTKLVLILIQGLVNQGVKIQLTNERSVRENNSFFAILRGEFKASNYF